MLRFIAFLFGLFSLAVGALTSDLVRSASEMLPAAVHAATSHADDAESRSEAPARISPIAAPAAPSAAPSAAASSPVDARAVRLAPVTQAEAETVVYVEGDIGVALRGFTVSPHVRGAPVGEEQVSRLGGGVQIYQNGRVAAEVALTQTPEGVAVDWVWAPAPYYAVTFPTLGVRVTGTEASGLQVQRADDGTPGSAAGLVAGTRVVDVEVSPRTLVPATPLALREALRGARADHRSFQMRVLRPGEARLRTARIAGRPVARAPAER